MDHTALTHEACALLRAARHLRRAGNWDESAAALRRAAALIQRSVAVLDARLRHITARLTTPGPLAPLRPVVLVVDDEHAILRLLTVVLGGAGFEVLTACCGPSAVTACHPGVDLVLLDGQLRGPWDGRGCSVSYDNATRTCAPHSCPGRVARGSPAGISIPGHRNCS